MYQKTLPKSFFRRRTYNRWQRGLQFLREIDSGLLGVVVALTVLGGLMIQSIQLREGGTDGLQQMIMGGLGVASALGLARWRYDRLLQWHWLTFLLTNLALIAVIAIGVTANGAQSWINIGSFNVQPSEFAKLGLIITLASLLHKQAADNIPQILKILGITAIPWTSIMLQPDLGTGLVFGAITLGMLYWANMPLGWLIVAISPVVSAILFHVSLPVWIIWALVMGSIAWLTLPWRWLGTAGTVGINLIGGELGHLLWGMLKEYQRDRLTLFLNPEKNPLGGGYQLIQSRIAIGSGQLMGKGLHHGTQTQLDFIPEQHTDFIFSAIGEELGFIGTVAVLIAFWLIFARLLAIANQAKDNFGSLLAIGVLSMIAFQVILNISMTVGLAPITGIPLPWLSYGRSALITNFLALGLVESVAFYRPKKRK
jgi:rod shape determining protein RodA